MFYYWVILNIPRFDMNPDYGNHYRCISFDHAVWTALQIEKNCPQGEYIRIFIKKAGRFLNWRSMLEGLPEKSLSRSQLLNLFPASFSDYAFHINGVARVLPCTINP